MTHFCGKLFRNANFGGKCNRYLASTIITRQLKQGNMKSLTSVMLLSFFLFGCSVPKNSVGTDNDRQALEQTSIGIRAAFAKGDIPTILSYHHNNVRKALGYKHIINGKAELENDLKNTFSNVKLKWLKNDVESLIFQKNTAIEMTAYTIEITPNDGSKPFISKGRAMIIYVRDNKSPFGWASIRELIQPESE
jgi:ketosteroid isomerase-like protein